MKKLIYSILIVIICVECLVAQISINLESRSNIFASGRMYTSNPGGGGGGILPFELALDCTVKKLIFPEVKGQISITGEPSISPEGWSIDSPEGYDPNARIPEFEGLSDVISKKRALFLAGVFLDDSVPEGVYQGGPNIIQYDLIENRPALNQIFYIGDGLTGTGSGELQEFFVPKGATRLFLGFPDAPYFKGPHGYYGDNKGSVDVTIETCSVIDRINSTELQLSLCKETNSSQLDLLFADGTVLHSVVLPSLAIENSFGSIESGAYAYLLTHEDTACEIYGNLTLETCNKHDLGFIDSRTASGYTEVSFSNELNQNIYEILWNHVFAKLFSDDSSLEDYSFSIWKKNKPLVSLSEEKKNHLDLN